MAVKRYAPSPPAPGAQRLDGLIAAALTREADRATWGPTIEVAADVLAKRSAQGRPTTSQRFRFANPTTRID